MKNGIVHTCRIFGDFFSSRSIVDIERILAGTRFVPEDMRAALARLPYPLEEYFTGANADETAAFLAGESPSPAKRRAPKTA